MPLMQGRVGGQHTVPDHGPRVDPAGAGIDQVQVGLQMTHHRLRAGQVAFVDDVDVADFQDAGLGGLDLVTQSGHGYDDHAIGQLRHLDVRLPAADGLDDHAVEAQRPQDGHDVLHRPAQASDMSTR